MAGTTKQPFAGSANNADLFRMGKGGLKAIIAEGNPRTARVKQAKAELARRKANERAAKGK